MAVTGMSASVSAERVRPYMMDSVLVIPAGIRQLPAYAFAWNDSIREVRVEEGSRLLVIGDYAFAGCGSLVKVEGLPETLASIGEGAFRECVDLERFVFPRGVKEVPRECFIRCKSLREVVLHGSIYSVKAFSFTECEYLRGIELPESVSSIGLNAFALCRSLEDVVVPEGVTELESYAFAGCWGLRRIVLPGNPSRLGELILEDCGALEEIVEMSPSAPAFECGSWLCDPAGDADFYKRVRLVIPETEQAQRSYRRAHCWSLFF